MMEKNFRLTHPRRQWFRKLLAALLALTLVSSLTPPPVQQAQAASPAVFINEIHYDNTGTDAGEAIEIAGPAGTDLAGWSLVLYNGYNGTVYNTNLLSGIIPNQQNGYGTLSFSYPENGIQNGSPDGVALVDSTSTVVQFLSYEGTFTAAGGPANGLLSTDIGVYEPYDTPLGSSLQLIGGGTFYTDFAWNTPAPNTFGGINSGQTFDPLLYPPVIANCGAALSTLEGFAAARSVSASDADGTVIDIAITSVMPDPSPGGITLSDLVPAAGVGGTATAVVNVDASVPSGSYSVLVTASNNDTTPQTGTCTLAVTVVPILPIGAVQGPVADTDNGLTHASPFVGQYVYVQGVIYEKTLARTSSGGSSYGFFLQNTADTADSDPNSSDGIFIYIGRYSTLRVAGGGYYTPQTGDEILIQGPVSEYYNFTQISNPYVIQLKRSDVDLDAELPAGEVNPPNNLADANRYWERREGMRVQVPAGSIAIDGRDVFAGTADAEIWLARGDHPIALRTDEYDRRAFRDPHPVDNDPALFDDGNGYRIILGSMGVKATAGDNTVLLPPARTFDTMTNAPIGGIYFSYSKYQIMVAEQPDLVQGADPALNSPPQVFDRAAEYSLAPYNVENLYDYRDDPFDGCDFPGNPGCPGVTPPFDYVPASAVAYEFHLNDIAQQIVSDLHSPDILLIQEAEDQDICTVSGGALVCDDLTNNADGKPDTLQELALAVAGFGGPAYDAAYDRDGADDRGIVSGFLYRTDRVELLPAEAGDPVLGSSPTVDYRGTALPYNTDVQNPKALNADLPDDVDLSTGSDGTNVFTRPPQVGLFRVWKEVPGSGAYLDLYAVSNHFSSTPNARVGQRTEQSLYNAAIVAALQAADPDVKAAVGGDFNVYPRPDDPFVPGDPLYPSDQLAPLYNQGLNNLYDALLTEDDDSAYSYIFQGQTQTLDQVFVTPSLSADLTEARAAHVNADFPADYVGDVARGASDHDPLVARFCRAATTISVDPGILWPPNHKYVPVSVSVSSDVEPAASAVLISATSNEPDNGEDDGDTINDIVIVDDFTFKLRAERSGIGTGRIYTLTYSVTDSCGNVSTVSVFVIVPLDIDQLAEILSVRLPENDGNVSVVYNDLFPQELYLPVLFR